MPFHPWLALMDASLETARRTLEALTQATAAAARGDSEGQSPPWRWTTRNRIIGELATMRLRAFHKGAAAAGPPVIVVAPFALHAATTADFAKGHSVVESLLDAGLPHLALTDWRSAGPRMADLTFDSYLAELNAVVDDAGAPAALVGLCQGGLLAAIYAARFPHKVSRLALAGAPLDTDADPSPLTEMIRGTPPAAIDGLIAQGDGVLRAALVMSLWPTTASAEADIRAALQLARPRPALVERFAAWNADLVDLPGAFYRQTVDFIFRRNAFARRQFPALGRTIGLKDVHCPLFLLAAREDEIVSPAQVLSARALVASPRRDVTSCLVEGRHLSLYMGRSALLTAWPDIAAFLAETTAYPGPRSSRRPPNRLRRVRTPETSVAATARTVA